MQIDEDKHMEENGCSCGTDTMPIPIMDVERKTVPVICPWCDALAGVAKWEIERYGKIQVIHRICSRCMDFVKQCIDYPDGSSFWR